MNIPRSEFSGPAMSLIIIDINYSLNAPSGRAQIQNHAGITLLNLQPLELRDMAH